MGEITVKIPPTRNLQESFWKLSKNIKDGELPL
jgi:hypothetical protein